MGGINVMNEYYVYEHWIGDTCIYVGSGNKYRPTGYGRNDEWTEYFPSKDDWYKVRDNVVNLYCITFDRQNAFDVEEWLTTKRKSEGHPLTNKAEGRSLYKENNGFYGKKHSKESIDKMRKKHLVNNKGPGNPMYGKRSANALYISLYYKDNLVKDFDSLKECKRWLKDNVKGFPLKALADMSKTGKEYKAFHSKYKKYEGYRIEKYKENVK